MVLHFKTFFVDFCFCRAAGTVYSATEISTGNEVFYRMYWCFGGCLLWCVGRYQADESPTAA